MSALQTGVVATAGAATFIDSLLVFAAIIASDPPILYVVVVSAIGTVLWGWAASLSVRDAITTALYDLADRGRAADDLAKLRSSGERRPSNHLN
jgi:hypothetical protein